jgi:hypothetical protein
MIIEFPNKGVSFTIPKSITGLTIQFKPKPSPWNETEFDESQYIISYELIFNDDAQGEYNNEKPFPEPIIFEAQYTERQVKCVGDKPENLVLAFKFDDGWTEKNHKEGNKYKSLGIGSRVVHITHPGDPMVAWGP